MVMCSNHKVIKSGGSVCAFSKEILVLTHTGYKACD